MNRTHPCSGREVHMIKDQTRALKTHLSELIVVIDRASYNG